MANSECTYLILDETRLESSYESHLVPYFSIKKKFTIWFHSWFVLYCNSSF